MIIQGETSVRQHGNEQSLEGGVWEGGAGVRVSISCCLTTTEIGLNENTGVSQHDHTQHNRGSMEQPSLDQGLGQISSLLPFSFWVFQCSSDGVKGAYLPSTWHYYVAQKLSPRMPIIFSQNLARLVGPPVISHREKWGQMRASPLKTWVGFVWLNVDICTIDVHMWVCETPFVVFGEILALPGCDSSHPNAEIRLRQVLILLCCL